MPDLDEIVKQLESKLQDCTSFQKKYKIRKEDGLVNYYEGGEWALKYALSLIQKENL